MSHIVVIVLLIGLLALSACAESAHQVERSRGYLSVPSELEQQIDTTVAFADLRSAPGNYVGRVIMVAGVVIKSKRTEKRTEIEVLQLPAEGGGPSTDRTRSEGRFLAFREEFLDPATVPPGTAITVVAVVTGSTTRPLDDSEYTYPVLAIKHLTDWSTVASQPSGSSAATSYYGPYYSPFGYWGRPYGAYPYFGRPAPFFNQPRPPSPSPPPRHSIPPQFRKGR